MREIHLILLVGASTLPILCIHAQNCDSFNLDEFGFASKSGCGSMSIKCENAGTFVCCQYNEDIERNSMNCYECPVGFFKFLFWGYRYTVGIMCLYRNLQAGYFQEESKHRSGSCDQYLPGRYQDSEKGSECKMCPDGQSHAVEASASISDCKTCPEGKHLSSWGVSRIPTHEFSGAARAE